MGTDEPEEAGPGDETLSSLYELADSIACDIANLTPDWCQIARDAKELAQRAQEKCCCLNNDLTR